MKLPRVMGMLMQAAQVLVSRRIINKDNLPVEAGCKIMAVYCLILPFPFSNTAAPVLPSLHCRSREGYK